MGCSQKYSTAQEFATFWKVACQTSEQETRFNMALEIAASDIWAALSAAEMCSCTFSDWAAVYLMKLNIVDAAVLFHDLCGLKLSDDVKRTLLEWVSGQLTSIRKSEIELCAGETGADFPAIGWATPVKTEFQAAEIALNDILKNL